jgi:hypothetical protein
MSLTAAKESRPGQRWARGEMNFIGPMQVRPRYHANDVSRDIMALEPHTVDIEDARGRTVPPSLDVEGFAIYPHASAVRDFRNAEEIARVYAGEIQSVLLQCTGADEVVMIPRGVLRFSERSADSGRLDNSRPARFVHIDVSDATAREFALRSAPRGVEGLGGFVRAAHYNAWRVLTPPPQDVPLALCEASSVAPGDLVPADAVFDIAGQPEWSFEGLVIRYNPAQRWVYFADMHPGELLLFKTKDTDPGRAHHVPHSAFTDHDCPPGVPPRTSIEMRAIAYWYDPSGC